MKAIMQDAYGPADVLTLRDRPEPAIGDDDVLVRVHAAGVDPGVWHYMTGLPLLSRLGFGLRRPKNPVRGLDLAGVVERVGRNVRTHRPGDEVFGQGDGTYAEFARARADRLVPKPAGVSFVEAAAAPVSGYTALGAVRAGKVAAGQRVLIFGAAGGVGHLALQLARARGATVTGVCRPAKTDLVRSLGADTEVTGAYDVIIDTAGNRPLKVLRSLLTPAGTAVLVGGEGGGGRLLAGFDRQMRAAVTGRFGKQRIVPLMALVNPADLETLAGLLADGTLRPAIDRTFPLARAGDAIRHVNSGEARGKVVVAITEA
jgi:NADPH:quinone reductase-like Zn-dependent oxidoreductase